MLLVVDRVGPRARRPAGAGRGLELWLERPGGAKQEGSPAGGRELKLLARHKRAVCARLERSAVVGALRRAVAEATLVAAVAVEPEGGELLVLAECRAAPLGPARPRAVSSRSLELDATEEGCICSW